MNMFLTAVIPSFINRALQINRILWTNHSELSQQNRGSTADTLEADSRRGVPSTVLEGLKTIFHSATQPGRR